MISQKDLYDIALERQMYEDIKNLNNEQAFYTLLIDIFSSDKKFETDFLWAFYLDALNKKDFSLDSENWILDKNLSYPQSSFEQARVLLNFFNEKIVAFDQNLGQFLTAIEDDLSKFIKSLIAIKIYSLAVRRYPQSIDKSSYESITNDSHWIKRSAKNLIYINSGCEYGDFSHHKWQLEEL